MSWSVALAILISAVFVGRILDAGLHKYYTPKLKDRLEATGIWAHEVSLLPLIHEDAQRARDILIRVFGTGISGRLLQLTIVASVVVIGGLLILIADADRFDVTWRNREVWFFITIFLTFNVLADQVSLAATRHFLGKVKASTRSLLKWLTLDAVVLFFLAPLPLGAATMYSGLVAKLLAPYISFLSRTVGPTSYTRPDGTIVLIDPISVSQVPDWIESSWEIVTVPWIGFMMAWTYLRDIPVLTVGFVMVVGVAVLPTLVHVSIMMRDLIYKIAVRPTLILVFGLCDFLVGHKQPLTWILGTLGGVPVVVTAWTQVVSG